MFALRHLPPDAAADLGAVEAGHHPVEHGQRRRRDAACRWRHASAPSATTVDVELPALQRLRRTAAAIRSSSATSTFMRSSRTPRHCSGSGRAFSCTLARELVTCGTARRRTSLATVREHDVAPRRPHPGQPAGDPGRRRPRSRPDGAIPRSRRMFGYREAEHHRPPDRRADRAGGEHARSRQCSASCGFDGQTARSMTQRRRKDGSIIDVELTVVPLSHDGSVDRRVRHLPRPDGTEARRAPPARAVRRRRSAGAFLDDRRRRALGAARGRRSRWTGRSARCGSWTRRPNKLRCLDLLVRRRRIDAAQFEQETRQRPFRPRRGPGADVGHRDAGLDRRTSRRKTRFSRRRRGGRSRAALRVQLADDPRRRRRSASSSSSRRRCSNRTIQILRMFAALGQQLGAFVGRTPHAGAGRTLLHDVAGSALHRRLRRLLQARQRLVAARARLHDRRNCWRSRT